MSADRPNLIKHLEFIQKRRARLFASGDQRERGKLPATQVFFEEMIDFIWMRFESYRKQKSSVAGWAADGKAIREAYDPSGGTDELFKRRVKSIFGLPNGGQA